MIAFSLAPGATCVDHDAAAHLLFSCSPPPPRGKEMQISLTQKTMNGPTSITTRLRTSRELAGDDDASHSQKKPPAVRRK